ncbi:hypothetical protein BDV96DRAFT_556948 [Lophiotrema nucula]|uniref:t-SNARE coiled-coil homology domain-containing protein n=1 Tax=Lophiotrema nucula TaxID=690887 RepID=A0A6A5YM90_9PLEO|nr:hypothetical protein BDV96DRAFT_556948 [Lophiotrema nucula]
MAQPDFTALNHALNRAGTELSKLGNIPAVYGGNQILQELQNINTSLTNIQTRLGNVEQRLDNMDQRFDNMDQRFDNMDQRFDNMDQRFNNIEAHLGGIDGRLDGIVGRMGGVENRMAHVEADCARMGTRMDAMSYNLWAVQQNSRAGSIHAHLIALHNPSTNVVIPNFPATANIARNMLANQIDALLQALGVPPFGGPADRMVLFLSRIGYAGP